MKCAFRNQTLLLVLSYCKTTQAPHIYFSLVTCALCAALASNPANASH